MPPVQGSAEAGSVEPFHVAVTETQQSTETPLMAYQTQHTRIVPAIALAYTTHFVGEFLGASYTQMRHALEAGSGGAGAISAMHGLSSALKAVLSETASAALEDCRRCCGGQGYMLASGLPGIVTTYVHVATAGGDTYVLTQQAYKQLVAARMGMATKGGDPYAVHSMAYLSPDAPALPELGAEIDWSDPVTLVTVLRRLAAAGTDDVAGTVQALMAGGLQGAGLGEDTSPLSFAQACMHVQVAGLEPVWAHTLGVMLEVASRSIGSVLDSVSPSEPWVARLPSLDVAGHDVGLDIPAAVAGADSVQATARGEVTAEFADGDSTVMTRLLCVFGLHSILAQEASALRLGVLTPAQTRAARQAWLVACRELVPLTQELVDALDVPQAAHGSVLSLGGDAVFEALWASAQAEPLNSPEHKARTRNTIQEITALGKTLLHGSSIGDSKL